MARGRALNSPGRRELVLFFAALSALKLTEVDSFCQETQSRKSDGSSASSNNRVRSSVAGSFRARQSAFGTTGVIPPVLRSNSRTIRFRSVIRRILAFSPHPPLLNRKDRKERKEDPFVRDTQRVHRDVFAFLAVLAVPSGTRSCRCSTSHEAARLGPADGRTDGIFFNRLNRWLRIDGVVRCEEINA